MSVPAKQESALVTRARSLVQERVGSAARVRAALDAARAAKGLVVTDEHSSVACVEASVAMVAGQKELKEIVAEIVKPLKDAIAAVQAEPMEHLDHLTAKEVLDLIAEGAAHADRAQTRWLLAERERAARETREAEAREAKRVADERAEQERIAKETREAMQAAGAAPEVVEAAVEAAVDVNDVAPPMDVAPTAAPRMVKTASGSQHLTEKLTAELEPGKLAEVDEHLVDLRVKDACDKVRWPIQVGDVPRPGIGKEKGVVIGGVRYWYEPGVAKRGK